MVTKGYEILPSVMTGETGQALSSACVIDGGGHWVHLK